MLDTSGRLLLEGVKGKPAFVKPNLEELQAFCGAKIDSARDAALQIKSLLATGIGIVAVSLGAKGALVGCEEQIFEIQVPRIKAENPVGSGDAFVGGIAFGLAKNWSLPDTLRLAGACGTANACCHLCSLNVPEPVASAGGQFGLMSKARFQKRYTCPCPSAWRGTGLHLHLRTVR